jgi:hypothetical protein
LVTKKERQHKWEGLRQQAAKWWSEHAGCSDAVGKQLMEPKICQMATPPEDWEPADPEPEEANAR